MTSGRTAPTTHIFTRRQNEIHVGGDPRRLYSIKAGKTTDSDRMNVMHRSLPVQPAIHNIQNENVGIVIVDASPTVYIRSTRVKPQTAIE